MCVFFFFFFCFFCIYVTSLYVLWVASIVDLRVFWQPGSVLFVLNCRDYSLFESNKFLLLLLLLHLSALGYNTGPRRRTANNWVNLAHLAACQNVGMFISHATHEIQIHAWLKKLYKTLYDGS